MGNTQQKAKESPTNDDQRRQQREEDERVRIGEGEENDGVSSTISFTCEICIEEISSTNERFDNGGRCRHPFCNDCLSKYIEVKAKEDNVAHIACPCFHCDQTLDPLSCRSILSSDLFNKWCDVLCDSVVLDFETRFYCPYEDCSALMVDECNGAGLKRKCQCPDCKRMFCSKCKVPWHAGYWCSETNQRRDENDVVFGEMMEQNRWTRCPKCGQSVDRIDGCRYVKCRCGTSFCHLCGKYPHVGTCTGSNFCYRCCCSCCTLFILFLLIFLPVYYAFR